MANNNDEIRDDKRPEAANEPLMPGDNTIKPTGTPSKPDGLQHDDNSISYANEPTLGSAPDIAGEEGTTENKSS